MDPFEKPKKVALYVRLTTEGSSIETQKNELRAVAKAHGWQVTHVFQDEASDGKSAYENSPVLQALLNRVVRGEFDLIAAYSVNQLGRSMQDFVSLMVYFHDQNVDLYLHQQDLESSAASRHVLLKTLATFLDVDNTLAAERVRLGLKRAKANGKTIGRPKVSQQIEANIVAARATGMGIRKIAKAVGVGVGTVIRVLNEAEEASSDQPLFG